MLICFLALPLSLVFYFVFPLFIVCVRVVCFPSVLYCNSLFHVLAHSAAYREHVHSQTALSLSHTHTDKGERVLPAVDVANLSSRERKKEEEDK